MNPIDSTEMPARRHDIKSTRVRPPIDVSVIIKERTGRMRLSSAELDDTVARRFKK